jgi:hypothetical protein
MKRPPVVLAEFMHSFMAARMRLPNSPPISRVPHGE